MLKKAKSVVFTDEDGDAVYVNVKCGKRSKLFHQREYEDPNCLASAVAGWCHQQGAAKMVVKERAMTGEERLVESLVTGQILAEIVQALAAEAEGLEKWSDFPVECLADIAGMGPVHISYVEGIFEKVSRAFAPMVFCELAVAEDRPEAFASDPTFLTPVNDGFNRIKDVIYGNTRAERMMLIDLRK